MSQTVTIVLNTTAVGAGVQSTINGLNQVRSAVGGVDSWLKRLSSSLLAIGSAAVGVGAIAAGFKNAVATGVQFNATVQDATLGIAAVLKQFDAAGRFKSFNDAIAVSTQAIDALKKKATESPASFRQLVQGFQAISGAATGAGVAVKDQVDLVVLMSQALSGLGIRSEQLIQESRALITGNINEDAAAARILGITKAQIEAAKSSGQLFEFLTGKLTAFAEAGKIGANGFTTALSNLGDVVEQKLGDLTVPVFEAMRQGLLTLTATINSADLKKSLGEIADSVASVTKGLFGMAKFGVENIRVLSVAVDALSLAFGILALRAGAALGAMSVRALAPVVAIFGHMNRAVTLVSTHAGVFAGLATSLSSWTSSMAILGSAFAGWQTGKWLNDLDLLGEGLGEFGAKMEDVVTFNILKAMQAWEKFKISLGAGDQGALDAVGKSIEELLAPKKTMAPKAKEEPAAEPIAKTVDIITTQRLFLENNSARIAEIENNAALSSAQRNRELAEAIQERLKLYRDLEASVSAGVKTTMVADENGVRFTKEYADAAADLNRILEETARLQGQLALLSQDTFGDRLIDGIRGVTEEFENMGAAVADVLINGVRTAIDTVSTGIWQIVDGTATWGDLTIQVGRQIISGLIQIGIQEIILHNLKKGIMMAWSAMKSMFVAKDVAVTNAGEAAKLPALTATATLSSIGSWGVAVAIGLAAIAAVLASLGAFEKGGVVQGGEQLIRVNEGGRIESVLNARATAMLGPGTINALNAGDFGMLDLASRSAMNLGVPAEAFAAQAESTAFSAGGGFVGSANQSGGDGKAPMSVSIILVDGRNAQAAKDFMASSSGKAMVADIVRDQKTEIGIR